MKTKALPKFFYILPKDYCGEISQWYCNYKAVLNDYTQFNAHQK